MKLEVRKREIFALWVRTAGMCALAALVYGDLSASVFGLYLLSIALPSALLGVTFLRSDESFRRHGSLAMVVSRALDVVVSLVPLCIWGSDRRHLWLVSTVICVGQVAAQRSLARAATLVALGCCMVGFGFLSNRIEAMLAGTVCVSLIATLVLGWILKLVATREDHLEQNNQRLQAMLGYVAALSEGSDIQSTLALFLRSVVRELKAESGYIMLADPSRDGVLQCESAFSTKSEMALPFELSVGEGLTGYVFDKKQPIALHNLKQHDSLCDGIPLHDKSAMAVPITSTNVLGVEAHSLNETIGTLTVIGESFGDQDMAYLVSVASLVSVALGKSRSEVTQKATFLSTLERMATALEARDEYTRGHSERVCELSLMLAESLGFGNEDLNELRIGAILLDIGKIGVPDAIVNKKGALTDAEFEMMKAHPVIGYELCQPLMLSEGTLMIIRNHHERLDGSGYPDGLRGGELPPLLRIACVADAFDAMSSLRPYRGVMSVDEVFSELSRLAGVHFDPLVVEAMRDLLDTPKFKKLYAAKSAGLPPQLMEGAA